MINCDELNSFKELIRKSIEWHESIIPDLGQSVDEKNSGSLRSRNVRSSCRYERRNIRIR